jgi:FkbM family methyltransferase
MGLPFNRTIKQVRSKGITKTVAYIMAVSLTQIMKRTIKLPKEEKLVQVNMSEMIVYPRKGAIHADLFRYKKREPLCTDYLMRSGVIQKGDIVLDIGANIGYYVLTEANIVGETGKVYAVEPVSSNFKLLQKNVQLNNLTNVSTFQYAIGDKNVLSEIFVSNSSNLCAVSKDAVGGEVVGVQPVHMVTIDEFVKDKQTPKLIRMDVEGYEYEILKGMNNTLKGNVKILMELHAFPKYLTPKKLDEIYNILEQNNYRAKFVVFENKVIENKLLEILYKKSGDKLPVIAADISLQELKRIVKENEYLAAPNVLFEKEEKRKD